MSVTVGCVELRVGTEVEPDPRWLLMVGGFDERRQPLAMTYESLAGVAADWPTTSATPRRSRTAPRHVEATAGAGVVRVRPARCGRGRGRWSRWRHHYESGCTLVTAPALPALFAPRRPRRPSPCRRGKRGGCPVEVRSRRGGRGSRGSGRQRGSSRCCCGRQRSDAKADQQRDGGQQQTTAHATASSRSSG